MRWRQNLAGWDWREEGFQRPAVRLELSRRIVLYRVWGGRSCEGGNPSRPGAPGSQVFIETEEMQRCARKFGSASELIDDMGSHVVIPHRDPGKQRSS